jgi:hypothetical protein
LKYPWDIIGQKIHLVLTKEGSPYSLLILQTLKLQMRIEIGDISLCSVHSTFFGLGDVAYRRNSLDMISSDG